MVIGQLVSSDSSLEEAGFKLSVPLRRDSQGSISFSAIHTEGRNPVEFPLWPYELHDRSKCEGHLLGRTAHHYLIFETAGGFCGISWNSVGITRFQLPTRSAKATERILLRRVPGAERGAPAPEVAEAVAAVKRYFEGEETDFSGFRLDLDEQDPFFERIYAAARRVAWGHTTTYGALANELGAGPEAARDVGQAMARNPVALIIPCLGGRRQGWWFFRAGRFRG